MGSDLSGANDRHKQEQVRRLIDWCLNEWLDSDEDYEYPKYEDVLKPGAVEEMIQNVRDHPIDPAYDEVCESAYDGTDPVVLAQIFSRLDYEILKEMGALPDELRRPDDPPKQTDK
mgnify:CR=1 FL=1